MVPCACSNRSLVEGVYRSIVFCDEAPVGLRLGQADPVS